MVPSSIYGVRSAMELFFCIGTDIEIVYLDDISMAPAWPPESPVESTPYPMENRFKFYIRVKLRILIQKLLCQFVSHLPAPPGKLKCYIFTMEEAAAVVPPVDVPPVAAACVCTSRAVFLTLSVRIVADSTIIPASPSASKRFIFLITIFS